MARQLPRPEADLVLVAIGRTRLRCAAARVQQARIRRLALERLLGAHGGGNRVQARGLPAGARGTRALSQAPPRAQAAGAAGRGRSPGKALTAMLRNYVPLKSMLLQRGVGYAQPTQVVPEKVTLDDVAASVMTDLTRVTAVIILPGDSVDEAHRRMLQRGVRLLLVVDQDRRVVGLITATDILGEKPVQAASERGLRR